MLLSVFFVYLLAHRQLESFIENRVDPILMATVHLNRIINEGVCAENMLHGHAAAHLVRLSLQMWLLD